MTSMKELYVDPERHLYEGTTGIYVRAKDNNGKWYSVDVATLTKKSLLDWLTSRGGSNAWAENTVGIILDYGPLHETNTPIAMRAQQ